MMVNSDGNQLVNTGMHWRAGLKTLFFLVGFGFSWMVHAADCVRVYYDAVAGDESRTYFGRVHAMYLDNLLGHFPHLQTFLAPIANYQTGQIESCKATIYVSTYYDAHVPKSFLEEFISTKKNVAWLGYNIWKLDADTIARTWGVKFKGFTKLDPEKPDGKKRPGFYRYYSYRDEEFEKYGEWDAKDPTRFHAAFEISVFEILNGSFEKNVLSWASHTSRTEPRIPYVLANNNKWYFGDSPFSYSIESDRYLIFADVLFDILGELPRRASGPKPALFRVEDVHAMIPQWQILNMVDVLRRNKVPFSMTLIPIFSDPFGIEELNPVNRFVPLTRDRVFLDVLAYAQSSGASIFLHGLTHQFGRQRNPFSGVTGSDFEFWDRVRNTTLPDDSVEFVQNRIEDGVQLLQLAGIRPLAWVTPHYQASPVAYSIFAQYFQWTNGRHIYFPYQKKQAQIVPEQWTVERSMVSGRASRANYTRDLVVTYDKSKQPNGQFYPYEIFGDQYGQRVIPENIGNVQAYMNEQVLKVLTVDGMIANMRRNRVLRDVWASYFIHPFCLSSHDNAGVGAFPGDVREIERLIKATRDYGYEFVDIASWINANTFSKRKPTIEEEL